MKITDAAKHFGNRSKLARALGITPSAVYMRQKATGDVLPEEWAMKLHFSTNGELKFSPDKSKVAKS
nr:Cro/CI family transcriptional regulator [Plesiomonas shigelloides]